MNITQHYFLFLCNCFKTIFSLHNDFLPILVWSCIFKNFILDILISRFFIIIWYSAIINVRLYLYIIYTHNTSFFLYIYVCKYIYIRLHTLKINDFSVFGMSRFTRTLIIWRLLWFHFMLKHLQRAFIWYSFSNYHIMPKPWKVSFSLMYFNKGPVELIFSTLSSKSVDYLGFISLKTYLMETLKCQSASSGGKWLEVVINRKMKFYFQNE